MTDFSICISHLLLLDLHAAGEVALAEVVLDSALLGNGALGEDSRATEGTCQSRVLHADDADVAGTANGAGAGHASGHLHGNGEVHGLSSGQTANAEAGNVLGDLSILEGTGVCAARGGVNGSSERAGTVLVDLVEGHGDGAIIAGGGQALGGGHTSGGLDGGLAGALGGLGAAVGSAGQVDAAGEGLLVQGTGSLDGRGVGAGTVHEDGHHRRGIDGAAALSTAKSRGAVSAKLTVTNDGGVGFGTAGRRGAVTRCAVLDGETGKSDFVGAVHGGDNTVGDDLGGREGGEDERGVHFGS